VTHVIVTWTASTSTNVVGYNVYRKLANQSSFSRVATVTGTSFTDTNIDSSVVFDQIHYFVRAVNSSSGKREFQHGHGARHRSGWRRTAATAAVLRRPADPAVQPQAGGALIV